jgi:hypothetical protein
MHFRLFVDPELNLESLPAYMRGDDALVALETDWADKQTMLKMPNGTIDYHLLTSAHIAAACDLPEFGSGTEEGCEWPGRGEIDAGYLPHQHELIHAYMNLLSPGHLPIPFITEGAAQSIGCNAPAGSSLTYNVPWEQAVVEVPGLSGLNDVYIEGGLFCRYLIRTQGIDAFVRYYQQAPERRDPALFEANFVAFWNMSVDDVWSAMHTIQPGAATTDATICPCSLPALPTDAQPNASDQAMNPYWTQPNAMGASIGLTAAEGSNAVFLLDCDGSQPPFGASGSGTDIPGGAGLGDKNIVVVQLPSDGRQRYFPAPIGGASVAQYLSDSCDGTVPYQVPANFLAGPGDLWVGADQTTPEATTKYLQLAVPSAGQVTSTGLSAVCDTCDFGQGACQPPLVSATVVSPVARGSVFVKITFPPVDSATALPYPVTAALHFTD